MKGLAYSSMRIGKKYRLTNYRNVSNFTFMKITENGDYKLQDLTSLDYYLLSDLTKFGKGNDFEIQEINHH